VERLNETVYFDSVYGKPVFMGPVNRPFREFFEETLDNGWLSFRD